MTGKVQNANSTWINGRHFLADVETALKREVRMANDANCLAVSEAYDGAGQQAASVFGVILGTGCGGGLVVNGNVITGRHGIAGEWGHNPLPWAMAPNYPVLHAGAVATAASRLAVRTALSNDHYAWNGVHLPAEKIALNANAGDGPAIATLNRHLDRCGRGVAHVINIFDPEIIVLGGGLSGLSGLVERLPAAIAPYVFADAVDIRVEAAKHGPASGVRGAARLWSQ